MTIRVDRERIEGMLQDGSRSLRDIAREAGCSDWTVRSIARQLRGDSRPMKRANYRSSRRQETRGVVAWAIGISLLAALSAVIWYGMRGLPPQD